MKSLRLHFAVALYRWNLSAGIISILFSALAFVGIFALAFAAPWYMLLLIVAVVILGTGFILDRGIRIWEAQSLVGTIRNPWLVDRLYQKEFLQMKHSTLPQLRALRFLLTYAEMQFDSEPKFLEAKQVFLMSLDESIMRIEHTLQDKKWKIESKEEVYHAQT